MFYLNNQKYKYNPLYTYTLFYYLNNPILENKYLSVVNIITNLIQTNVYNTNLLTYLRDSERL